MVVFYLKEGDSVFSFIQQRFNIYPKESFQMNQYTAVYDGNFLYIIVNVHEHEQDQLVERFQIAEYLRRQGEKDVPMFQLGIDRKYVQKYGDKYYVLLKLEHWRNEPFYSVARALASFHQKGFTMQSNIKNLNRIGKWKQLWEKRIDHLQKLWQNIVANQPANEFERLFVESFPYYAGISENAIQYFVDTTIDDTPQSLDSGTICHERFQEQTWARPIVWKNPFDWLIDHPSRDLAEWTRNCYFNDNRYTMEKKLQQFFHEYQLILPLSSFAWRLLYARLILPLHYIQMIEGYFYERKEDLNRSLEKRLRKYLDESEQYEQFLTNFFDIIHVPKRSLGIPKLDWLTK